MIRAALLALLAGYKRWVSPQLPAACRFTPTCSEYAAECVRLLPPWRALPRILWRVLRCNPLFRGGYDPVLPSRAAE
jgi:putative membrane protein insertion efficiency factor